MDVYGSIYKMCTGDYINIMDVYGSIYKMCTGDYINIMDVYGSIYKICIGDYINIMCVYKMCTGGYINIMDLYGCIYIKCVQVTISKLFVTLIFFQFLFHYAKIKQKLKIELIDNARISSLQNLLLSILKIIEAFLDLTMKNMYI